MKYIYSIILLSAIAGAYYFINENLNKEVPVVEEYEINISPNNTDLKKLSAMDRYDDIYEKPLFAEGRELEKQAVKKKVNKPKPVVQDLRVQALGIALTGEGVLAVIKDLKNGKIARLRINDQIYGWTLESVSDGKITFTKNKQNKVIAFKQQ